MVDAAAFPLLPELLEAHGEEARCLSHGRAGDQMANGAPWLARLSEGSWLLRTMVTRRPEDDVPWHLLGTGPA